MIAHLLAQSRVLHLQKKHLAGKVGKDGMVTSPPNYPAAEACIAEALALRREAHRLDPDHADPAWAEDLRVNHGVPSRDLMAWYEDYLTVDPIGPVALAFRDTGQLPGQTPPASPAPPKRQTRARAKDAKTGQNMTPGHGVEPATA